MLYKIKEILIMPPNLALLSTLIGSNYPCLELMFMVPKVFEPLRGWSGGAMVLGKLPVPGRPTSLDKSRTRAYCSCSRCGWGLFGHFYSHLSFLFSFSLRSDPIYTEIMSQRVVKPKNNQQPNRAIEVRLYVNKKHKK